MYICKKFLTVSIFIIGVFFAYNALAAPVQPTLDFTASATSVSYGGSSTLTWSSKNTVSCTIVNTWNQYPGTINLSDSLNTGALTKTTTYSITCKGGGTTSVIKSLSISVG